MTASIDDPKRKNDSMFPNYSRINGGQFVRGLTPIFDKVLPPSWRSVVQPTRQNELPRDYLDFTFGHMVSRVINPIQQHQLTDVEGKFLRSPLVDLLHQTWGRSLVVRGDLPLGIQQETDFIDLYGDRWLNRPLDPRVLPIVDRRLSLSIGARSNPLIAPESGFLWPSFQDSSDDELGSGYQTGQDGLPAPITWQSRLLQSDHNLQNLYGPSRMPFNDPQWQQVANRYMRQWLMRFGDEIQNVPVNELMARSMLNHVINADSRRGQPPGTGNFTIDPALLREHLFNLRFRDLFGHVFANPETIIASQQRMKISPLIFGVVFSEPWHEHLAIESESSRNEKVPPKQILTTQERKAVKQNISDGFNLSELKELCFDLGVGSVKKCV